MSGAGVGWRCIAAGSGHWVQHCMHAKGLLKEVATIFIPPPWFALRSDKKEGTQPRPSTENWIKELLNKAPLFLCIDHSGRLSYISLLFSGTLHSDAYNFPFLLGFSPLFFSQLFVRPPQTAILIFCICFPWGWSWSLSPIQCHAPLTLVHQALYLSDLVSWIYFSLPLYNHKGFYFGHTWMV